MRHLLLALLLFLAPASAWAATCTCSDEAFSVASVTDAGGWDGGCSPSAGDDFVIGSGCAVTITDDFTQDTTAGIGITVQSGGSLIVNVSTEMITVTVGADGLDVDSGGSITLLGKYREFGSTSLLDAFSRTSYFQAGNMLHCLDGSCDADTDKMRFDYPAADYDEAGAYALNTAIDTAIGGIKSGEVLCFFDPDQTDSYAPPDTGFCYKITADGDATTPYGVEFSVDQGTADTVGALLASRRLAEGTLGADSIVGQRTISLGAAGIIDADRKYVGRCIRFEDGTSGVAEPTAYRIQDSEDDAGGDTVTLASLYGARTAHASGDAYWIDYCWKRGDPFYVEVPVVIASATSADTDGDVTVDGTANLRAVVFRAPGYVSFTGATISSWSDVWIEDPGDIDDAGAVSGCGEIALCLKDLPTAPTLTRTQITGGSASASPSSKWHGLVINGGVGITVDTLSVRYSGDDGFAVQSAAAGGATPTGPVNAYRYRWEYSSQIGSLNQSTQYFDGGDQDVNVSISDGLCIACGDAEDAGSLINTLSIASTVTTSVSGLSVLGAFAQTIAAAEDDRAFFTNLFTTGSEVSYTSGVGNWIPSRVDRWVIRESSTASTSGNAVMNSGFLNVRNGFARNVGLGLSNATVTTNGPTLGAWVNNALIDIYTAGTCNTTNCRIMGLTQTYPFEIRDSTVAYTTGFAPRMVYGVNFAAGSHAGSTLTGLLVTGLTAASGAGIAVNGATGTVLDSGPAADVLGPLCTFDSTSQFLPAGAIADMPAGSVMDKPPGYKNEAVGSLAIGGGFPASLAECGTYGGTRAPGIRSQTWSMSILDLAPEFLEYPRLGGGGGGGIPRAF